MKKRYNYMIISMLLILMIVIVLFYLFSGKEELPPGVEPGKEKEFKALKKVWKKVVKEGNVPMAFYGVVSDEEGHPIEGAAVKMSYSYWRALVIDGPGVDDKTLETQKDGKFVFIGERGFGVSVEEITKPDYEWVIGIKPSFKYQVPNELGDFYTPDPANPVKFVMRKKNVPELVFKNSFDPRVYYGKMELCYDVIHDQTWSAGLKDYIQKQKRYYTILHNDLMYKVEKSADGKGCVLTFKTSGEGNGALKTDGVVYTAPESSYQPELRIELPFPKDGYEPEPEVNLYFKLRTGIVDGKEKSVYCRMNGTVYMSEEWIRLNITSYTNPSGARNLDYSDEEYNKFYDSGDYTVRGRFENSIGFDEAAMEFKAKLEKDKEKQAKKTNE